MLKRLQDTFSIFSSVQKTRVIFRTMAVGLGTLHTYAAIRSQSMNADGIAYLDIGDAYFRADWGEAVNTVWSPLYSWILGLVNFIFKPPMHWEFPAVHLVNFLIYLFALSSLEYMWGKVRSSNTESASQRLPEPLWWMLGYLLFVWVSLSLIQMWSVTPDMLMAGFVFLAAGLVAQIRAGEVSNRIFLQLGLILGLGYLSKTFMFSIAPVFLALAWLVQKRTKVSILKTLLAAGTFLLLSLPFIILISNAKERLTIGEAGTVTFLRYVNGMPFPHWQGDPGSGVIPAHPSRVIHEYPVVYEFGEPIGGTYPITLDPSYWYEGIKLRFDFGGQLARLLSSALVYAEIFFQKQGILLACILAMYIRGIWRRQTLLVMLQRWGLVIPAVIAFGLYGTILVEERYIGVFVLLFWTDVLNNIRLPETAGDKTWLNVLGGIAVLGLLVNIVMFNLDGFKRLNPTLGTNSARPVAPSAKPLEVAQTLRYDLGVTPGDKVGVIGYAYDSFWARLAKVKIVAEMFETDSLNDFWRSDESLRRSVLHSFAESGVKAVVAEYVPEDVVLADWYQVGSTNYYIYIFSGQNLGE